MKKIQYSEKVIILLFFVFIILVGSFLLSSPFSWKNGLPTHYIDALFTSASAVCVTGLATVPVSAMSFFGQMVLLLLIQLGGLGFITLTSIYLLLPGLKISMGNRRAIRDFFITQVEHKPKNIVRNIIFITLAIELTGSILLWLFLPQKEGGYFYALFHAVSAYCNAGFSPEDTSLLSWSVSPGALSVVGLLIVSGGLGWVVLRDVLQRAAGKIRHLSFHSTVVLVSSFLLIALGTAAFFILEMLDEQNCRPLLYELGNALFYSVSTRTAGFSVVPPSETSLLSQLTAIPFMIIGASPGSTGGGVKTTTFLLFCLFVNNGLNQEREVTLLKHRISLEALAKAGVLVIRYLMIVVLSSLVLFGLEVSQGNDISLLQALFEVSSAVGTVGLSLDVTPTLTYSGKVLIILNMFAGRVGLLALTLGIRAPSKKYIMKKPLGEVMVL